MDGTITTALSARRNRCQRDSRSGAMGCVEDHRLPAYGTLSCIVSRERALGDAE